MKAEDVFIGLQVRNVRLNKPATIKELHSLESKLHITLHPFSLRYFLNLMGSFRLNMIGKARSASGVQMRRSVTLT